MRLTPFWAVFAVSGFCSSVFPADNADSATAYGNAPVSNTLSISGHFCPARPTTTVFVTISPSNPVGSEDDTVTVGPQKPTTTILISPVESSVHSHESLSQIPTITVTDLGANQPPVGTGVSISTTGAVDGVATTGLPEGYSVPAESDASQVAGLTTHTKVTVLSTHTVTISKIPPQPITQSSVALGDSTCITYTALGTDGLPTETSTWLAVQPSASCTTYTVLGTDGLPTVIATTVSVPSFVPSTTASVIAPPSFVPQSSEAISQGAGAVTTHVTIDIIGADGATSRVVETVVIASDQTIVGVPTNTIIATGLNIPALPSQPATALTIWPTPYNSMPAYGSEPVVVSPPTAALPTPTPNSSHNSQVLGDVTSLAMPGSPLAPPAYGYGDLSSADLPTIAVPPYGSSELANYGSPTVAPDGWASSILYGSLPSVVTPVATTPTPSNTTSLSTGTWTNIIPEQTTTYTMNFPYTTLVTITIPPLLAFGKRHARRQDQSTVLFPWDNTTDFTTRTLSENTSLAASLSSILVTPAPSPNDTTLTPPSTTPVVTPPSSVDITSSPVETPSTPIVTPSVTSAFSNASTSLLPTSTPICSSGGKVGNVTIDFDFLQPGPLLNPAEDFWFSEGFLIAPPSSPPFNSYVPSSGGKLVEFVPPALSPVLVPHGAGDTAEIGVGPNQGNPCYKFDFYGANLGCAAEGVEQWCEFDIEAYTYNETSSTEMSLAWSELKRVPACPNFPSGTCNLTPIEFDGYSNLTSILISLRVGLELRAWWGDDFKFGWTDNSCEATSCRMNMPSRRVKRKVIDDAVHRGVWQWTPFGLKRLNDEYIWSAATVSK